MAKFHPSTFYNNENISYQLLPFNFDRLEDKVMVTNLAGEYHFCSLETFENLHEGKLKKNSSEYQLLRSKHFLIDDETSVALKLLGIKYRTRLSRISEFTSLHMFVVSLRCEHSCPYCQVSRQSDDKVAFDMSEETAIKAIDFALSGPSPRMKFEFQGGESLLNFDLIRFIIKEAKLRNEKFNKDLAFVAATNLAVINDEMLDFFAKENVSISTSLDGPAEIHNFNRPRPGKDSYERTIAGIEKARNKLGFDKVSALMTTTDRSLNIFPSIIDEYIRLGFRGIFLRPLSPYGFAIKTKKFSAYGREEWFKAFKDGLDYIIEINKAGHFFAEYYSTTILKKIMSFSDPGYVDLRSPSGIGIGGIVYNYDGKIFASDEGRMLAEMGDRTFEIGDLYHDDFRSVFTNEKLIDPLEKSLSISAPSCSTCAYQSYCGAEPVFHYATTGDFLGRKAESDFCYRNMNTARYLISRMEESAEVKDIFERWIR